jgi:hypothetical protein
MYSEKLNAYTVVEKPHVKRSLKRLAAQDNIKNIRRELKLD